MNIEQIKTLAEIVNQNGLTKLEVSQGETKIIIEKTVVGSSCLQSVPDALERQCSEKQLDQPSSVKAERLSTDNLKEIKAPIVGVFYSSPTPGASPFVTIGSEIKRGDVLCIIEAMKLMNEIAAESDGKIVDICVKNGDIVEFGQVIFKVREC